MAVFGLPRALVEPPTLFQVASPKTCGCSFEGVDGGTLHTVLKTWRETGQLMQVVFLFVNREWALAFYTIISITTPKFLFIPVNISRPFLLLVFLVGALCCTLVSSSSSPEKSMDAVRNGISWRACTSVPSPCREGRAHCVPSLSSAFATPRSLILCLPCVACGVLWSWVSRKYQHFAILPLTMLAVPAIFFIVLGASGENMQARCSSARGLRGGGAFSFAAYLGRLAIDHAFLSRRSTAPTPIRDASNILGALYVFFLAIHEKASCLSYPLTVSPFVAYLTPFIS